MLEVVGLLEQMGFEAGFKSVNRVYVPDVGGEGVPEVRGRAAEGPSPHGGQTGRGDSEGDGGGRPEGPGRDMDV